MLGRVVITGIGFSGFKPITPELSYKELMYEAAVRAYQDAGIDPRRDVDSFVTAAEDYTEGTAIFDEYTPDQLGAAMRPMHTIAGDGLQAVAAAVMQILTGQFDVVVVEAHSKLSNLLTPAHVTAYALDPVFNRPLQVNPVYIAGMEMNAYLHGSGATREQCAHVVVKNRRNALRNPLASYGADLTMESVLASRPAAWPLHEGDLSRSADGAVVLVLASEERARSMRGASVMVRGVGWCSDAPSLETRDWGDATYARLAARMAYRMAGLQNPRRELDLVEVDDTFAYKELMHLEALELCRRGEAGLWTAEGGTAPGGELPVNVSGGSLGVGLLGEANGLARLLEAVLQLRGQAGSRQVKGVRTALVQSWRGLPSTTGAVAVLSV